MDICCWNVSFDEEPPPRNLTLSNAEQVRTLEDIVQETFVLKSAAR